MKIATKIIAGYAILMVMMSGLLAYQLVSFHRMQATVSRLADVNFQTADTALQMMRDLDMVDFFAQKSFVSQDPDYLEPLKECSSLFETDLHKVESFTGPQSEQAEIHRLAGFWNSFSDEVSLQRRSIGTEGRGEMPAVLTDRLTQLKDETNSVYEAARASIDAEVRASLQSSKMAETFSWIVASVSLILAALVSMLIVQSISAPLKQLTQGTRALAEGKFFYRLDTSRRDEFGQLAKDFNTMTRRLDELDRMKKDFVSHVSHELKAPLASMQEINQLLLEQMPGALNDKQKRLLELNVAGTRRLSAMIGNLLDVSRMEAGVMAYELKSADLTSLVRTVAAEFGPLADERALALSIEAPEHPVMVECDGDRIMQVIRNLIGNAVKFSPKGKEIRVRVTSAAPDSAGAPASRPSAFLSRNRGKPLALVSVADSGPGVPDEHKEKIFEKIHQVKQGTKVPGQGAGLGLAISKTIAEAHRGAIWVEDNPGGGSVFYLALPPAEGRSHTMYTESSPI